MHPAGLLVCESCSLRRAVSWRRCNWAFGDTDVYLIAEVPDNATAAAISLALSMSGAEHFGTVVLVTAEEMDAAAKIEVGFRAPGA